MISYLTSADMSIIAFIGVIFAFALTCIAIAKLNKFLPKDLGRQFAVDGKLSAGKPSPPKSIRYSCRQRLILCYHSVFFSSKTAHI